MANFNAGGAQSGRVDWTATTNVIGDRSGAGQVWSIYWRDKWRRKGATCALVVPSALFRTGLYQCDTDRAPYRSENRTNEVEESATHAF